MAKVTERQKKLIRDLSKKRKEKINEQTDNKSPEQAPEI